MIEVRMRAAAAFAIVVAACDSGYSVASSSDGGSNDGDTLSSDDAGAVASTDAMPRDASSSTDAPVEAAIDAGPSDAGSATFPIALGARLRLWLDATDTTTVTTTTAQGAVSTWRDKSDNHLVASVVNTSGTVFYVDDADAGSVHGIAFAGGGYLAIPDSPPLNFTSEAVSFFAVARYANANEPNQYNDLIAKSNLGATGYELELEANGSQVCGSLGTSAKACAGATQGFAIFELDLSAAPSGNKGLLIVTQLGQTSATTPALVAPDNAPFQIAHGVGGAFDFTGTIFELIVVDKPTNLELMSIASYLESKYGRP
jgi:hypothetical protein